MNLDCATTKKPYKSYVTLHEIKERCIMGDREREFNDKLYEKFGEVKSWALKGQNEPIKSIKWGYPIFRPDKNCTIANGVQNGELNAGHFHFQPGHEFLWNFLESVSKTYDVTKSDRHQAGPEVAAIVAKKMYSLNRITNKIVDAGIRTFFYPSHFPQIAFVWNWVYDLSRE